VCLTRDALIYVAAQSKQKNWDGGSSRHLPADSLTAFIRPLRQVSELALTGVTTLGHDETSNAWSESWRVKFRDGESVDLLTADRTADISENMATAIRANLLAVPGSAGPAIG